MKDFNLKHWRMVHKQRKSTPYVESKELKKKAEELVLADMSD